MIQTGAATTAKATTVITNSASHAALRPKKGLLVIIMIETITQSSWRTVKRLAGTAGVSPAMSAKRERLLKSTLKYCAPERRVCGRNARGPSKSLDRPNQNWMPCDQLVKVAFMFASV